MVTDILAGCNGDANAATAKLLELRDEEQAHDLAAAMQEAQELSAAPAKVCGRSRPCLGCRNVVHCAMRSCVCTEVLKAVNCLAVAVGCALVNTLQLQIVCCVQIVHCSCQLS